MEDALSLKRLLVLSWVYLIVLVTGAWLLFTWSLAWAVLAGGVIAITSFWFSYRDLKRFLDDLVSEQDIANDKDTKKDSKRGFVLKFWLRILAIGLVLLLLIAGSDINVIGLILGLTTVVFTITMSALGVVWRYYFSRR